MVQGSFGWGGQGPTANGPTQWKTMVKYAKKHGAYSVGFVTFYGGGKESTALRNRLMREAAEDKIVVFVMSARS